MSGAAAPNKQREAVTVVVDYPISFYALEPTVKELLSRGTRLYVVACSEARDLVWKSLDLAGDQILCLDRMREQTRRFWSLHRSLRLMVTSANFSVQYRRLAAAAERRDREGRCLSLVRRVTPKLPNRAVNGFLHLMLRRWVPNLFPTERVFAVSKSLVPELLCAQGLKVALQMESWDHPVKWPTGHRSAVVFGWNEDLCDDWRTHQGDNRVCATYPFKLRYALEKVLPEAAFREGGGDEVRRVLYAPAWSAISPDGNAYREERGIVDEVCRATARAQCRLLIKPKPQGAERCWDELAAAYSHVEVGTYLTTSGSRPELYYLDDEYNRKRFEELARIDLVMNALTTFGLDSAAAGTPVLQLDFRRATSYPEMQRYFENHHLRYLLRDEEGCLAVREGQRVEDVIYAALQRKKVGAAVRFSANLRRWIAGPLSFREAISKTADIILGL